jgi:hypothetical protein
MVQVAEVLDQVREQKLRGKEADFTDFLKKNKFK